MIPYKIIEANAPLVPIIVSIPHCGTYFPDEIRAEYKQHLIQQPDDTDWFVEKLYDFAPALGITMITAVNSRWVIDLNRDIDSKPLYTDGRIITALCPATTFLGEPLYVDERKEVASAEVNRRIEKYYTPYHEKIQSLLNERKRQFGKVLLWDCHSIRTTVPTIQSEPFPDLILGDNDEQSADVRIILAALSALSSGKYSLYHNRPFKGGTITRTFGKPDQQQHALQLEMTKRHYLEDDEQTYSKERSANMQQLLRATLEKVVEILSSN